MPVGFQTFCPILGYDSEYDMPLDLEKATLWWGEISDCSRIDVCCDTLRLSFLSRKREKECSRKKKQKG